MRINSRHVGFLLGPLCFFLIRAFFYPEGLESQANAVLATAIWMAIWWVTEAIPIEVTALLPLILFPLSGGLELETTASSFGDKYVFLYLGGFMLAIAIEKWNLHRRIALNIIYSIGTNITSIIFGFMAATAFMSMWISNTATTVMMLPIALAIVTQLKDNPATLENEHEVFGKALMLAIAYSASIGGMATLIGTPPNLVLAGVVKESLGVEITFVQWMLFGLPISIVLLLLCWLYLTKVAFRFRQKTFPGGRAEIRRQLQELGGMTAEERQVLVVFILTALAWVSRSFLLKKFIPAIDDTIIALLSMMVLFVLPGRKQGRALLHWSDAARIPWGILLLFGGGLALADGFTDSGLAAWIGDQMKALSLLPLLFLILIIVASVNFLTEITSNLATTAMLLPILAPMAASIGIHPYYLLVAATVAASCAFMLPVATPPNAIVFGSGYLRIPDMVRVGFWLNVISIVLLTAAVYGLLPRVWGWAF